MIIINIAEIRCKKGKSACRRLRKNKKIPAIIYGRNQNGGNQNPILIEIDHDEFINQECKFDFYHTIIIMINGEENKVKVQELQRHPFKPKITHIDFLRI
ncbi:50S ribosomal protein L25 [Candidatus Arsenophonus lipoptenae]|uniref:Large ribosomal subunit protein bL25 n=1 Tax=Candidatus Arsenophonus lipoptenae TaxID=634113 RepID=A0A120HPW3_9GAMM|nr:50S ribosomal protein L25 [Candidatus Arsenophonus lipoptenae]AMA64978.1 50S ribosomal protein L25 [Candidatus Arsenophonus lipoptenae]